MESLREILLENIVGKFEQSFMLVPLKWHLHSLSQGTCLKKPSCLYLSNGTYGFSIKRNISKMNAFVCYISLKVASLASLN